MKLDDQRYKAFEIWQSDRGLPFAPAPCVPGFFHTSCRQDAALLLIARLSAALVVPVSAILVTALPLSFIGLLNWHAGLKKVVLFGEVVQKWAHDSKALVGKSEVELVFAPSLLDLLRFPLLKRSLWACLRTP
ncbi:MAG: hypothetical protein NTV34_17085 [Proteobacteria bacterium]|nr:hypothetical protein [Pseudomonadota bacterium]